MDFYIVLPSNSCYDIHPENTANNFVVSWENPIHLDGEGTWKVAVTEINFTRAEMGLEGRVGIKYWERDFVYSKVTVDVGKQVTESEDKNHPQLKITLDPMTGLATYKMSNSARFYFDFTSEAEARKCGFNNTFTFSKTSDTIHEHHIISGFPIKLKGKLVLHTWYEITKTNTLDAKTNLSREHWTNAQNLVDVVNNDLYYPFENFHLDNDGRINFVLKSNIHMVEFFGEEFAQAMGFGRTQYVNEGWQTSYAAEYLPETLGEIPNMYIYANICSPMHVGDSLVPLLRSVWLNPENSEQKDRYIAVKYPMYVNVNAKSINSIEINIRANSGRLIPFPKGSVTSLTIHFQKWM